MPGTKSTISTCVLGPVNERHMTYKAGAGVTNPTHTMYFLITITMLLEEIPKTPIHSSGVTWMGTARKIYLRTEDQENDNCR